MPSLCSNEGGLDGNEGVRLGDGPSAIPFNFSGTMVRKGVVEEVITGEI